MEEKTASELGTDRWGPVSHVELSRLVLGSGNSLRKSQEQRNQGASSRLASSQAQLPALTLGDRTLVALVMPALPISGASGRWAILFPCLLTGPASSLSATPGLLLSPSRYSESCHHGSGVLGTQGWEYCHHATGVHKDTAVGQEGEG